MAEPGAQASRGRSARVGRALERIAAGAFMGSGIALGLIGFCYCYEVASRYFFNAPTEWAHDAATYLMCLMVYLAIPQITATGGHIAITFILEYVGQRWHRIITTANQLLSGLVCGLAGYISLTQNLKQFESGIQTLGTIPVPKWWISVFITFGLFLSGLLFLWQAIHEPEQEKEAAQ